MIKLKTVSKIYNNKVPFRALNNINLEINAGEFIAVTGKSGCGKTTLLNIIGLLDNLTSGDLLWYDENTIGFNEGKKVNFRNSNIGFVFQSFYLEENLTALQNIALPLIINNVEKKERINQINLIAEKLDIKDKLKLKVSNLSAGEKQRVSIARALICNPKVLLADEPCGNLDSLNTDNILNLFRKLANSGITVIMVTHNQTDTEKADRIVTLKDGEIIN